MSRVLRVALAGYNAKEDTDPSHYSVFSDSDNILIKEQSRGAGTISGSFIEITHNLGYVPFYLVYGLVASGVYQWVGDYTLHHTWKCYATTTKLVLFVSGSFKDYKYFIFHDEVV